ncbi:HD domain-containing protein [bacterium]|nr:HD domain-containing protein [bacterium]
MMEQNSFISPELLELIYRSASIERWNDHLRVQGFTELDKQAHKMIIAYTLGKLEEQQSGSSLHWELIIQAGVIEFFERVLLTDIKPPIYYELMNKSGPALHDWVVRGLQTAFQPGQFTLIPLMQTYFNTTTGFSRERRIVRASHFLATLWEFRIIYHLNQEMYGIEETKKKIEEELSKHEDLSCFRIYQTQEKIQHFIDLVGQLRYQKRWASSPRIPETSVLGHMLVVAILSYFTSKAIQACPKRIYLNFFGGLFHDLPEVLTRDIISPIKRSVEGLDDLIKQIECQQMENRIYPLLPLEWHEDMHYFTNQEFHSKILLDHQVKIIDSFEEMKRYNQDIYFPMDGVLIKANDNLAAFMEAYLSLETGIRSKALTEGYENLYQIGIHKDYPGYEIDYKPLYQNYRLPKEG